MEGRLVKNSYSYPHSHDHHNQGDLEGDVSHRERVETKSLAQENCLQVIEITICISITCK